MLLLGIFTNFGAANLVYGIGVFPGKTLLLIPYTKDDLSFSEAAYVGYQRLRHSGYPIDIVFNGSTLDLPQTLLLIKQNYSHGVRNFILAGAEMSAATTAAAKQFPDAYFATLSGNASGSNVINYCLDCNNIGGAMAGRIAAQMSKTKIVGFVGGVEAIDGSEALTFRKAVLDEDPGASVFIDWSENWNDFELAQRLTAQQVAAGADVIVADANSAVIRAALPFGETKVIGWMSDASRQYENVRASIVINTDLVYRQFIDDISSGRFLSGNYSVKECDAVWSVVWAK